MRGKAFIGETPVPLEKREEQRGESAVAKALAGSTTRAAAGEEDVPDIRNTRVIDIYRELESYGVDVRCYDPLADLAAVKHEYGIELLDEAPHNGPFDAVVLAVKHRQLVAEYSLENMLSLGGLRPPVIIEVKSYFPSTPEGVCCWQL